MSRSGIYGHARPLSFTGLLLALVLGLSSTARVQAAATDGIGWIPTWRQAISEAQRTNRPILLVSAAPHCGGVPGEW